MRIATENFRNNMNSKNKDIARRVVLTDSEYWDKFWKQMDISYRLKKKYYFFICLQKLAKKKLKYGKKKLLEVGCAPGRFLVYFAKEFGYEVSGIDYSKIGCHITIKNLCREGVEACIIEADLLSDSLTEENWDIVFSAGFVEHFSDPETILKIKYKLLKPGGVLLTTIPNFAGFTGLTRKIMYRDIYLKHNPITRSKLQSIYEYLGLENIDVGYFASLRLSLPHPYSQFFFKKALWFIAKVLDMLLVSVYKITNRSIEGPWISSHIYAYGVRPNKA